MQFVCASRNCAHTVTKDAKPVTELHTLTSHTSTVRALCFTPKGDKLCSSGGDFTLCVWAL